MLQDYLTFLEMKIKSIKVKYYFYMFLHFHDDFEKKNSKYFIFENKYFVVCYLFYYILFEHIL